jgi:hypothetical protein
MDFLNGSVRLKLPVQFTDSATGTKYTYTKVLSERVTVWNRSRHFFVSKAYSSVTYSSKQFKLQKFMGTQKVFELGPFYVKGCGGPT